MTKKSKDRKEELINIFINHCEQIAKHKQSYSVKDIFKTRILTIDLQRSESDWLDIFNNWYQKKIFNSMKITSQLYKNSGRYFVSRVGAYLQIHPNKMISDPFNKYDDVDIIAGSQHHLFDTLDFDKLEIYLMNQI